MKDQNGIAAHAFGLILCVVNITGVVMGNEMAVCQAANKTKPIAAATKESQSSILAERFYAKAEEIFEKATEVHYRHLREEAHEQVQELNTGYRSETDCSGFVSYVVNSVAPRHYAYLRNLTHRSHPHAALYARFFKELPAGVPNGGWLGVDDFRDLKRGDIIAWERPPRESDANRKLNHSGHVMIVVDPPGNIQTLNINGVPIRFVEVNVLDSSGVKHFPPESLPPMAHQSTRDGLGKGLVRLIVDEHENVTGYWEGVYSETKRKPIVKPTSSHVIGFARLLPLSSKASKR